MKIVDYERTSIADGMAARIDDLKKRAADARATAHEYERTAQREADGEARYQQARGMLIYAGELDYAAKCLEEFEPEVRSGRKLSPGPQAGYEEMHIGFAVPEESWDNALATLEKWLREQAEAEGKPVDEPALKEACEYALYEYAGDACYHALEWAECEEVVTRKRPSMKDFRSLWEGVKPTAFHEYQRLVRNAKKKAASRGGNLGEDSVVTLPRAANGGQGGAF